MKSKSFLISIPVLAILLICAKTKGETSSYERKTFATKEGTLPYRILFGHKTWILTGSIP